MTAQSKPSPEREAYYRKIAHNNLAPLWEVIHDLVLKEPRSPALPVMWRYDEVRPYVMEAGSVISAKEAERRVLVLENPGLRGQTRITTASPPCASSSKARAPTPPSTARRRSWSRAIS